MHCALSDAHFFLVVPVLKCLHARYSADVFYTHAGCTLVAVNPFKHVPCLYSLEVMKEYHVDPQPQVDAFIKIIAVLVQCSTVHYPSVVLIQVNSIYSDRSNRFSITDRHF